MSAPIKKYPANMNLNRYNKWMCGGIFGVESDGIGLKWVSHCDIYFNGHLMEGRDLQDESELINYSCTDIGQPHRWSD